MEYSDVRSCRAQYGESVLWETREGGGVILSGGVIIVVVTDQLSGGVRDVSGKKFPYVMIQLV